MERLYQLTEKWDRMLSALEAATEDGGEIPPALVMEMDSLEADFNSAVDWKCKLLAMIDASAAAKEREAERLRDSAARERRRHDWLKFNLKSAIERLGLTKVKTDLFSVSICNNSQSKIEWVGDMKDLPAGFLKMTPSVDTDAAREVVKEFGVDALPKGFEVTRGKHLRIR